MGSPRRVLLGALLLAGLAACGGQDGRGAPPAETDDGVQEPPPPDRVAATAVDAARSTPAAPDAAPVTTLAPEPEGGPPASAAGADAAAGKPDAGGGAAAAKVTLLPGAPELGYPGSPPRVPQWGFIHIFESHSTLQGRHEFDFFKDASRPPCSFKTVGPCVQRSCPMGEGTKGTEVSAGKVAVRGSITRGIAYAPLVMVYGKYERYFNRHHDGVQWVPGEVLTTTAEGADVPALEGKWAYPSRLAHDITVPVLDRKEGGTFRWRLIDTATVARMPRTVPTDVGKFVVKIPGTPQVTCFGPIGAGALAIPGEAIAHLGPSTIEVTVEGADWGHVRAGDYVIYLEAREEHQKFPATVR